MYCFCFFSNKLNLKQETSFFIINESIFCLAQDVSNFKQKLSGVTARRTAPTATTSRPTARPESALPANSSARTTTAPWPPPFATESTTAATLQVGGRKLKLLCVVTAVFVFVPSVGFEPSILLSVACTINVLRS